jgi:spore coat protein CotH
MMSGSRYFDRIAVIVTALTLVLTLLFINGTAFGIEAAAHTIGYEDRLFDNTRVHTIDIVMEDWDEFIADAAGEEYDTANVVIDGEPYRNVGIRAKGNTSLSAVAALDSERYSFKIEFDHYESGRSYHGLDKLCLNNLIQDSTMMKDYLTYTMMKEFGVISSLCSYVWITVNGEDWGLYLAVEGVEESFLKRNYGSDYGRLYKPDSTSFGGGQGNGRDFDPSFMFDGDLPEMPAPGGEDLPDLPAPGGGEDAPGSPGGGSGENGGNRSGENDGPGRFDRSDPLKDSDPPVMPGGGFEENNSHDPGDSDGENDSVVPGGGFGENGSFGPGAPGMGASDVKLQYMDEDPDSYSNIWDNAKTDMTEADQARLIESLRKLSDGEDLKAVVDTEQVIRYFVVHNYVCNGDSYTGSMVHNYYLYEKDGQMSMIPWDYNLAFGTFDARDAAGTVNTPIDTPVSGGSGEDRPMWNWIPSNEAWSGLYHQYFSEFLSSVDILGIIDDACDLIRPYVEKDPTAFYTYEEFETGVETLRRFCDLRSESILLQLESGETTENRNHVDASDITLSDMGSMDGMGGDMPGGRMPG